MIPYLILFPCLAATVYQVLAIVACLSHLKRSRSAASWTPGVSILKPVSSADEHFAEAIRTHAEIRYPEFEILFGIRDRQDAAWAHIERLKAEYPRVQVRSVLSHTEAPNAKVGVLEDLAAEAKYPVWVVNDADISVPADYLSRLTATLANPKIGLVTCLYRATASSAAGTVEALGVATDFAPSALVAPYVGVREFGLGSTLAFRSDVLVLIGGFAALRDYLADDYQLGKLIHARGFDVEMSDLTVSTHVGGSWREVWHHQVRWARTIRISRSGYFGLPVTNATFWALGAAIAGQWWVALGLLMVRMMTALIAGVLVLRDPLTRKFWWLVPVRDLLGMAVWVAGATGKSARWRGDRLRLDRSGRIVRRS